jgi:acetyltransferase-like isoleucine patch superfamily enzyme
MGYTTWFNNHAKKHKIIVNKLVAKSYTKEQIIDYFDFDNMLKEENNFCSLYKNNKKCHDMKSLNCYLCACPNFRFNDDGLGTYNEFKILSKCNINNGEKIASKNLIHHNCLTCSVPHHKTYVRKNFDLEWKKIMKSCKA